jgi:hypothetical protein
VKMRSMSVEVSDLFISLVSLHSLMKFLPSISTERCRTEAQDTSAGQRAKQINGTLWWGTRSATAVGAEDVHVLHGLR